MWFAPEISEGFPVTAEDRLADAEKEAIFAEAEFDRAVSALRNFNIENQQMPMSFTNSSGITRIQTLAHDGQRACLERDVRQTLERRNKAWAARATLLLELKEIR
jgi:hypothetical protein